MTVSGRNYGQQGLPMRPDHSDSDCLGSDCTPIKKVYRRADYNINSKKIGS